MGNFSYICPLCRKNIRDGEVAHLRHIRHGEVLGETVGRYDGYGRVYGDFSPRDAYYRASEKDINLPFEYKNSHEEICISEFSLEDSMDYDAKIYEGKPYNWCQLRKLFGYMPLYQTPPESFYELWKSLPKYVPEKKASGTSAYHEYCYRKLTKRQRKNNTLSKLDPRQGEGEARDVYCNLV